MFKYLLLSYLVVSVCATSAADWAAEAERFSLGPVPPLLDLRNMLTQYVVRRSCATLDETAARRRDAFRNGVWEAWRDGVRKAVRESMAPLPFGPDGGPLNVREVSRHERDHYVVENVLFESLPGLDVNASVFLPDASEYPPPWPAIVVPVGHSSKTEDNYQQPCQTFARLGYVAITFDPPGMAGEKQGGNDHFSDGVRCYLTGVSSNRYFVIDALRCLDYLATRPDVDSTNGVGITGVSGGGVTSMHAALLDNRIAVCGPSCCAVPKALHPVLDHYAECPEVIPFARFREFDDPDLLAAAMPKPVLLMAGAADEVFNEAMSQRMADETAEAFRAAGYADRFEFFLDTSGHAYTPAMTVQFVRMMDKWVRGTPDRELPAITKESLESLPTELLRCAPRLDRNMWSVNRDEAATLREKRSGLSIPEAARLVAGVTPPIPVPQERRGAPSLVWFHYIEELSLSPEPGIELPATFLYPSRDGWQGGALLYIDDRGRWTDLRSQGWLTRATGFTQRDTDGPAVLSIDLRGWGDTTPADVRYDLAGWGSRERWLAYISAGLGDSVLAMRIRDALSVLAWLCALPNIDPARIFVGGRGMGGVVALHTAAIDGGLAGVFSFEGLASFEALASSETYAWPPDAFLPNVLRHYDLPELAAALPMPCLFTTPLDANRQSLPQKALTALIPETGKGNVLFGTVTDDLVRFVHE